MLFRSDTWSAHAGVEVPIPSPTLFPPLGVIERKEEVLVANLSVGAEEHPDPFACSTPVAEN